MLVEAQILGEPGRKSSRGWRRSGSAHPGRKQANPHARSCCTCSTMSHRRASTTLAYLSLIDSLFYQYRLRLQQTGSYAAESGHCARDLSRNKAEAGRCPHRSPSSFSSAPGICVLNRAEPYPLRRHVEHGHFGALLYYKEEASLTQKPIKLASSKFFNIFRQD